MRLKSEEKFKDKIRELTRRSHNLNASVIKKVNQVVRGTANYFAAPFTRNLRVFTKLDKWIRMRLRCMKLTCPERSRRERKWKTDNKRLRLKFFRKMGLLSMYDLSTAPG